MVKFPAATAGNILVGAIIVAGIGAGSYALAETAGSSPSQVQPADTATATDSPTASATPTDTTSATPIAATTVAPVTTSAAPATSASTVALPAPSPGCTVYVGGQNCTQVATTDAGGVTRATPPPPPPVAPPSPVFPGGATPAK